MTRTRGSHTCEYTGISVKVIRSSTGKIVELVVARVLLLNTSGIAVEMGIGHCHQVRACSGLQPRSDVIDLAFVAGQKQKYNRLWDSKPEPVGIDDSTFSCCNQLGQKTTKTRGYPCTQICGYAYPRVFPQINPHWPTGNSHSWVTRPYPSRPKLHVRCAEQQCMGHILAVTGHQVCVSHKSSRHGIVISVTDALAALTRVLRSNWT
ncbi:hypothetical protein B0H10DRAFT_1953456 [Mycena sp. CBHHK59/15]|nr:hypothetical protein B0H10DRAFT_1953456 [Mycena sp. CBHHK59/15]